MPKPCPVVCAEAWSRSEARPPVACRSPARSCAPKPCRRSRSEARPGAGNCPAWPGPAPPPRPTRPGPAARRGAVRSGPAGPSAARPGTARPAEGQRRERRTRRRQRSLVHVEEWPTGRVVLPTFGTKSRKTTKSDPSTGDQFWESRKTAKFDAPVGLLGRVSRSRSNYDSLEEAQWPCASFCQLSENRGKRQSPIRLRGISWGNENFCLNLFQQSSVPWYADRWVNGGSNKEPLI